MYIKPTGIQGIERMNRLDMQNGSGSTCLGIVTSGLLSRHYVWLA